MGGSNQATATPPARTAKTTSGKKVTGSSVRFHEDTANSEAHFHDDKAKKKCAVDYALFSKRYADWRNGGEDELIMLGHDGKTPRNRTQVCFHLFPDDATGQLEVAMTVGDPVLGQTLTDLDKMANL